MLSKMSQYTHTHTYTTHTHTYIYITHASTITYTLVYLYLFLNILFFTMMKNSSNLNSYKVNFIQPDVHECFGIYFYCISTCDIILCLKPLRDSKATLSFYTKKIWSCLHGML